VSAKPKPKRLRGRAGDLEVLRTKPSAAKGKYLRKVAVTTTMGPGIPVDPSITRNLREAVSTEA
jgi:large subunit ribosomal protein L1